MSVRTMTTRIGGYKFVIETNGSQAIGEFDPENGDGMSLPFELRSCWTNNTGQTMGILAAAIDAVQTLQNNVDYTSEYHGITTFSLCHCEKCDASVKFFARREMSLRGNHWSFSSRLRKNFDLMLLSEKITVKSRPLAVAPQV